MGSDSLNIFAHHGALDPLFTQLTLLGVLGKGIKPLVERSNGHAVDSEGHDHDSRHVEHELLPNVGVGLVFGDDNQQTKGLI